MKLTVPTACTQHFLTLVCPLILPFIVCSSATLSER